MSEKYITHPLELIILTSKPGEKKVWHKSAVDPHLTIFFDNVNTNSYAGSVLKVVSVVLVSSFFFLTS